jgi:VCBS repeat-containing protein
LGYNISETTGFVGSGTANLSDWTMTVDLSDPGVTTVTGDFDQVTTGGTNQGEAPGGYVFSALNTTAYGTLSFNTTDGTFTFTIDRSAVFQTGSDQTVTFTITGTSGGSSDPDNVIINLLVCVTRGTLIRTDRGRVPVEDVEVDDLVWTLDNGLQPVRWIGSRRIGPDELRQDPTLRPIRIAPGMLGDKRPRRPLSVSPQHRVLLRDWRAQLLFGEREVLVAAKGLINDRSIRADHQTDEVEYFHLLFDSHQIIETDGALTESFHPGPWSTREIDGPARDELFRVFPELAADIDAYGPAARMSLKTEEVRLVGALDLATGSTH